ncbi:MAG: sulfatase [Thermoanaerobaculia bacterium]
MPIRTPPPRCGAGRRPGWTLKRAPSWALLGVLGWLAACGPRPVVEPPLGWHRLDLTRAEPAVALNRHEARPPFEARIGFLGREEVRDMTRVPERQLRAFPHRRAPQIRVLDQAVDTRLAWEVELGEEPYASFIPLGWRGEACRCRFRFGLRDSRGRIHELHREAATEVPAVAPSTVEVDLSDFAHSRVEILLQVDRVPGVPRPAGAVADGTGPSLLWGSPAIHHREPVDHWRPGTPERPNVVLLGLDTVRADHVGPWRQEDDPSPSLTPAIDRLAGESDVWLQAYSTFSTTNPSFASILTGLYGKDHGVYDLKTPLPSAHRTLAEVFSDGGYETLAVISASHLGDHNSGLGQGFDRVELAEHTFAGELPVDTAMDWIAERPRRAGRGGTPPPFFAWLHLFDPHTPHSPTAPYAVGFRPARPMGLRPVHSWLPFRRPGSRAFDEPVLGGHSDLYAAEVAYVDRQVDRLLGFLASRRLLERTVVVLVSDHGENLGEHGIDYRHVGLWDTTVHVPLLVRWPGAPGEREGRRLEGLVQTLDLFPTLLATAELQVPEQDGTELDLLTGEGRRGRRVVFAEHFGRTGTMVRTATHKYIRMAGDATVPDGAYLYNLVQDPEEERNLAGRGLAVEAELAGVLERFLRQRREGPEAESRRLSEEERRKLEALGYVQ